jgi:tRNA A-37 threonylcarbamoyl transferase component Bud32
MSNVVFEHPSGQRLQDFALGQLGEDELAEIEAHLNACAGCRQAAESVADDTLIALLRSAATDPDSIAVSPRDGVTRTAVGSASSSLSTVIPDALANHSRYRVLELLGVGGMGAVYRAEHLLMQRQVALKVINHELIDRPATIERFEREVRAAARLVHPNIVTAFDAEQAGELHFLVMEYVEGTSLARRLAEKGPLGVAEACHYIRQAALGLQHAHERGMVHRDIKPHNLVLTPAGQVKILDFGLARFAMETAPTGGLLSSPASPDASLSRSSESITQIGMVMGTPDYIAPEQARDAHTADIRADIYSLGCTLYDLLTGQAPFPHGTAVEKVKAHLEQTPRPVTAIRPDVPPELRKVIDRLLAKDPADRFQTPAEVAEALAPFLATPESGGRQSAAEAPNRPRWQRLALAAAAVVLFAAGTVIYVQTDKGKIVIDVKNTDIAVLIKDLGGVTILDKTNGREYRLQPGENDVRSGDYQIQVSEPSLGLDFSQKEFRLTRGQEVRVTARLVPGEATGGTRSEPIASTTRTAGSLDADAFNWFPIDCTFLAGRDLRAYPGLSEQQLLVLELLASAEWKDRVWKLHAILGRVDRIVGAVAEDREHPQRLRTFVRVTGRINHQRLVDWFRTEYPSAHIREIDSQKLTGHPGESITVAISSPDFPAAAIVNDTDVVFAADTGQPGGSAEAINQVLRLRSEGRIGAMPQFHELWSRVPPQPWAVIMGQVPAPLQQRLTSGLELPTLPDALVLSAGGSQTIQFRLEGAFRGSPAPSLGRARAAAFAEGIRSLQQRAIAFVRNPPSPVQLTLDTGELLLETLQSLRAETAGQGNQVTAQMQVRDQAVAALVDALRDLPLSVLRSLLPFEQKTADGRLAALAKIVAQKEQHFKNGSVSLGELIEAKLELCQAELELTRSRQAQAIVLGQIVELKQKLEDQCEKLLKAQAIPEEALLRARIDRLKAQEHLERVLTQDKPIERQSRKERLAVLQKIVDQQEDRRKLGSLSLEELDRAKLELARAELGLAESDQQRAAALDKILKLTKELEDYYDALHKGGRATEDVLLKARADRIKAELDLKRAKAKATGEEAGKK